MSSSSPRRRVECLVTVEQFGPIDHRYHDRRSSMCTVWATDHTWARLLAECLRRGEDAHVRAMFLWFRSSTVRNVSFLSRRVVDSNESSTDDSHIVHERISVRRLLDIQCTGCVETRLHRSIGIADETIASSSLDIAGLH